MASLEGCGVVSEVGGGSFTWPVEGISGSVQGFHRIYPGNEWSELVFLVSSFFVPRANPIVSLLFLHLSRPFQALRTGSVLDRASGF